MQQERVEEVVARYRGLQLHTPEPGESEWTLVASKRTTTIKMDFGATGLRRYRISWVDTIMHSTVLPEVDLCEDSEELLGTQ